MKILFSPSEAKYKGGTPSSINESSFMFPELFEYREETIKQYKDFINNASNDQLAKLFGTKKQDVIDYYKSNITKTELMKVIERYDGVAFDYLEYSKLKIDEKNYIDKNVIIFSNLFGPISAGDNGIPDYKLKQGEKLNTFVLESYYKNNFSNALDDYFKDEDILDLRAGFYEKFYKINKPYYSMKFIKNGKVVSHWAKAYRGIILKLLSQNNIQTFDELINMKIEKLNIEEIKEQKMKKEIIYSIND
jgi:cytoplasmic iron level regulating protein YaaA (DUF328/UPF0246 family)